VLNKRAMCSKSGERVVVDGQCTTSRGPGTAFEFALSLTEQLCGQAKMAEVADPMVMYEY
jgi:protein deglycase